MYLRRVEYESDKRVLMYLPWGDLPAESPTPITQPASTADTSPIHPGGREPPDPHQAGQGLHQTALAAESPNPERMAPQLARGDVIDFLNFSEIYEQPQELRVGSSVVNILNSRTFFMKKLNPSSRRGCTKNLVNTYSFVFFR